MGLKIVLCGDGSVGKTSLRYRFMGYGFSEKYHMTIGTDFAIKELVIQDGEFAGNRVMCQIWDLAGQPTFQNVRPLYYSGTHGILLIYDCTRPETFYNIENWAKEAIKYIGHPIPCVLIANKIDLRHHVDLTVASVQGTELASKLTENYFNSIFKISYIETSAKTGEMVEFAFQGITKEILNYYNLLVNL